MIKLVVGLGNPGPEYENTYHSVGIAAVLHLARHIGVEAAFRKHGDFFDYAKSESGLVFAYSRMFMNESGLAVREAVRTFDVHTGDVMVVHDDSDLPLGEYKYSFAGSSAGHKGVQSVIDHLGTNEFWRMRIGVRDPREVIRKQAGDFVLTKIKPAHEKILTEMLNAAAEKFPPAATDTPQKKAESS